MRNILLGVSVAAIAVGIAVFSHPDTNPVQTPTTDTIEVASIPFREIAHGSHSAVSRRVSYLITSPTGLLALWKMIDAEGQPPEVDFTYENVIAVFTGNVPTAGYDIKVSKIEDTQSRMVTVLITKPGASCLLADSVTNPYQIIALSKTALAVGHEDQEKTISCLQ
jgi:hypothetical protein